MEVTSAIYSDIPEKVINILRHLCRQPDHDAHKRNMAFQIY